MAKMAFIQKCIQGFFLSITIEFLGQNTVGNYRKTCGFVPTKLAVTQKACECPLTLDIQKKTYVGK